MMHGYWGFPGGFGWFGGIFMLLFWVLVIVGFIWFFRHVCISHGCCGHTDETVLDILKKRYAKGELSKEEYETKKRELGL